MMGTREGRREILRKEEGKKRAGGEGRGRGEEGEETLCNRCVQEYNKNSRLALHVKAIPMYLMWYHIHSVVVVLLYTSLVVLLMYS